MSLHERQSNSSNIILLIYLLLITLPTIVSSASWVSQVCAAETNNNNFAYIPNGNQERTNLMRAWMCHGNSQKDMVNKLVSVSDDA